MSLQVWLPLNGNTKNYGSSSVVLISSGVTFTDGGKIGQKYLSGGTITIPAAAVNKFYNKDHMSFAFWLYPIGTSGSGQVIGQGAMSAGNNRMFTIYQYSTPNDLHLSWQDETSNGTFLSGIWSGFFPADVWTHCAVTYNGSQAIIYRNGVQYAVVNGTSNRAVFNYDIPIYGSSIRKLNDVRIYDHILSPNEIKEIASGLVLHYKLDNNSMGGNNLIPKSYLGSNCVAINSPYSLSKYGYIIPLSSGDNNAQVRQSNKLTDLGCWNLGDTYTVSFTAWSEGNTGLSCDIFPDTYGTSLGMPNDVGSTNCTTTPKRYIYTGILTNSTSSLVDLYIRFWRYGRLGNYIIYVTDIKIEKGSIASNWTPNSLDLHLPINKIYDSSGYGNNGYTIDGSFSSDGRRYQNYIKLFGTTVDNSSNTITGAQYLCGLISLPESSAITFAWWGKGTAYGRGGIFETTNTDISTSIVGSTDYSTTAMANWDSTFRMWNGTNQINFYDNYPKTDGIWHHHVFTFNGNNGIYYLDGVQKQSGTLTGTLPAIKGFKMGIGRAGGVYRQIKEEISDIRIYVTALSAEDIRQLYLVEAKIDNSGKWHTYEYQENQNTVTISNQGIISANIYENRYLDKKRAKIGKQTPTLLLSNNLNIKTTKDSSSVFGSVSSLSAAEVQALAGKKLIFSYDVSAEGTRNSTEQGQTAWQYTRYGIHGSMTGINSSGTSVTNYPFADNLNYSGTDKHVEMSWTIPTGYQTYGSLGFAVQNFDKPSSTNKATWYIKNVKLELEEVNSNGWITGTDIIEI